jgi:ribosomal protein S12 methylthiotransferase
MATFNIITMGCSKNSVDSEVIAAKLKSQGSSVLFESVQNTDYVIINTCGFIGDAKEESINEILIHLERKKAGDVKKVFVIGCLSERYKDELIESLPEADGIYGFKDLNHFLNDPQFDLLQSPDRILSTPSHYAYMKVSEGCDRECSYCAIPLIRGKQISKPIDLLVSEAQKLSSQGVKELILIAQDLTYYGIDISGKRDLEPLLRRLASTEGLEWIRLHYAYPIGFPYEILDVMNEYSNICKYIDIPLQHVSDQILQSMRRGGNSAQNYKLIETMRNKVPGIAIRTSLITGYPTETRKEHKELVQFVKDMRFERLGVFTYSPEENTPAFPLGDPVSQKEKNRRQEELLSVQNEIAYLQNQEKIGSVMRVLIDDLDGDFYIGRTEFDSPEVDNIVLIDKNEKPLEIGTFQPVYIEDAGAYELIGKVI